MKVESQQPALSVFSLQSGKGLLERVCRHLGIAPGSHEERTFEDAEHKIRPLSSVREQDVYVLQSLYGDGTLSVNDKLARLLFFIGALRDAGARRVTAVTPYLCYMRKDRRTKPRDPLTTRYLAQLFEAVGTQCIVALDVHNPAAFENAFRIPAEHPSARADLVRSIIPLVGERPAVVVSPDAGGFKRAEAFRQMLERQLARPVGFGFVEKFRSEGVVRGSAVAGEFAGRVAVIVDDLISTGGTLVRAALACRERGACAAYAAVTHGVFAPGAAGALENAALDRIVICDTIPPCRLEPELVRRRMEVIDCSPLVAECIKRLHEGGSLSELS